MPLASTTAAYTLINMASKFQEFFYGESGDVTFEYMNEDGEKLSTTVPNVAKVKADLEASAVTDEEMSDALKAYYDKAGVDAIRDNIINNFDNYYNKSTVDNKVKAVDDKVNATNATVASNKTLAANELATTKEVLHGEVLDVDSTNVMSKAQFEANAAARREQYAGSGFIEWGNTHGSSVINAGMWSYNGNYVVGDTLRLGRTEKAIVNVNGMNIKLDKINDTDWPIINFPDASRNDSVPVITDSINTPAMKQGDMAVLKDLNRELIFNGTFDKSTDGWRGGRGNISYNDDDKRIKIVPNGENNGDSGIGQPVNLIAGVEYELTCTIAEYNNITFIDMGLYYNNGRYGISRLKRVTRNGTFSVIFKCPAHNEIGVDIRVSNDNDDSSVELDNISIKQVSEIPIVALQDTDAGNLYNKTSIFEIRDSISRQDLVFLESWSEDIADKNIIYPFGNIQYSGGNTDGLSSITEGTFTGADSYSLFGNWQEPGELVGKGYVWSDLSLADKIKLASNPENNIYRDGEKWIQVRYRIRVVKGIKNGVDGISTVNPPYNRFVFDKTNWNTSVQPKGMVTSLISDLSERQSTTPYGTTSEYGTTSSGLTYFNDGGDLGLFGVHSDINPEAFGYNGICTALPISLVQRKNAGIWHESFNPEGCARVYSDGAAIMSYLAPEGTITSMADCFDHDLIATVDITDPTNASRLSSLDDGTDNGDTYKVTGTIVSKMSGRPDGLYADEINERDVEDLRMSAHKRNYDELREEYARKAVAGEIRGKEMGDTIISCKLNDRSAGSWDRSIYYNHNTNGINTVSIYGFYLVDKHNQTLYEKIEPFKSNIIINGNSYVITNARDNQIEFMVAQTGVSESSVGEYIKENITGTGRFDIMVTIGNGSVSNNHMTQVDIVGDPRNLNQRIKLDITEDTVINISRNDYVLCTTDDQTGGTAGHYYRYIAQGSITNVHTSDNSVGDANATDGHFDLSQDDTWLDLGTDGTLGGYPTTWLEHGVDGTPLLVTESGESMLPVVGLNTENVKNDYDTNDILGVQPDAEPYRMYFKASRKGMGIEKFLVRAKDGHWVTFTSGNWGNALEYISTSANRSDNHVYFNIGSDDTLDALGYSSMEEALDLMLVKVYYKTKSNFLELANNSEIITTGSILAGGSTAYSGKVVPNFLINKVNTIFNGEFNGTLDKKSGSYTDGSCLYGKWSMSGKFDSSPKHNEIKTLPRVISPVVKYFDYLTTSNNRARLQFVFKELKYDTDSSSWGDNNVFNIANKVSTLADENGNAVLYGQKSVDLPYFIK